MEKLTPEFIAKVKAAIETVDEFPAEEMPAAQRYSPEVLQRVGAFFMDVFDLAFAERGHRNVNPTAEQEVADRKWLMSHPPKGLTQEEWDQAIRQSGTPDPIARVDGLQQAASAIKAGNTITRMEWASRTILMPTEVKDHPTTDTRTKGETSQ